MFIQVVQLVFMVIQFIYQLIEQFSFIISDCNNPAQLQNILAIDFANDNETTVTIKNGVICNYNTYAAPIAFINFNNHLDNTITSNVIIYCTKFYI